MSDDGLEEYWEILQPFVKSKAGNRSGLGRQNGKLFITFFPKSQTSEVRISLDEMFKRVMEKAEAV